MNAMLPPIGERKGSDTSDLSKMLLRRLHQAKQGGDHSGSGSDSAANDRHNYNSCPQLADSAVCLTARRAKSNEGLNTTYELRGSPSSNKKLPVKRELSRQHSNFSLMTNSSGSRARSEAVCSGSSPGSGRRKVSCPTLKMLQRRDTESSATPRSFMTSHPTPRLNQGGDRPVISSHRQETTQGVTETTQVATTGTTQVVTQPTQVVTQPTKVVTETTQVTTQTTQGAKGTTQVATETSHIEREVPEGMSAETYQRCMAWVLSVEKALADTPVDSLALEPPVIWSRTTPSPKPKANCIFIYDCS